MSNMVGLVLVSHSYALACAAAELARKVSAAAELPIAAAGGTGADHSELGTDATDIMAAIESVNSEAGVVVLMDLGSAVLSARMALELLPEDISSKIHLCSAPLIEGSVAAAVQISAGSDADTVCREARSALGAKQGDIGDVEQQPPAEETEADFIPALPQLVFVSHLKNGLHARPASLLVKTLAPFKSDVRIENATRSKGPCSAKSLNRLALLGILLGDTVNVYVSGDDSEDTLAALKKLSDDNFGEPFISAGEQTGRKLVSVSPGAALADLFIADDASGSDSGIPVAADDPVEEMQKLDKALVQVRKDLERERDTLSAGGHASEAGIFDAHILILDDEEILSEVRADIQERKQSAAFSYRSRMKKLSLEYGKLPGDYMPQRAADVNDIALRVVNALTGKQRSRTSRSIILYAEEITPSMLTGWQNGQLKGLLSAKGGSTSHAAILARTLGIPAVSGFTLPADAVSGMSVIIDAGGPDVIIHPDKEQMDAFTEKISVWEKQKEQDKRDSRLEPYTADHTYIEIRANAGDSTAARKAEEYGAEGIGLLRTEFLFLDSPVQPSESEQMRKLTQILQCFPDKTVVIRTLDIGGDKRLPWLEQSAEDNPFLGVRGVRLCLKEKELFMSQLRAVLRAGAGYKIKIMIPMIDTPEEVEQCRLLLEKAHDELTAEKAEHIWPVQLGIMIETPAAVLMADELAEIADFFSIGSNDLTQYCMAAERGNSSLSGLSDARQPAVLRMIKHVQDAALRHGIPLSVCGEMAGSPETAQLLIGMGIRCLSMNPSSMGRIKRMITGISLPMAERNARKAMNASCIISASQHNGR